MPHLDGLKKLELLNLEGSAVGDDGMKSIAGHDSLKTLAVGHLVTPKGLAELTRMTSLDYLSINTYITDDALVPVGQMTNLSSLWCGMEKVTDEGLRNIKNMTHLKSLNLRRSDKVTDAGMAFVGK